LQAHIERLAASAGAGPAETRAAPPDRRIGALQADVVYLSTGSHDSVGGGDEEHYDRWRHGLRRFLAAAGTKRASHPARVILATTTAIGNSRMPSRYLNTGSRCKQTNARVRSRNQAASRAFLHACADEHLDDCRIVDLFSPSLAWIDDEHAFQAGDPVHPRGHLQAGLKKWLRRVLDSLLWEAPKST